MNPLNAVKLDNLRPSRLKATSRSKRLLVVAVPAAVVVLGGGGIAYAASSSTTDRGGHDPNYRSSVHTAEKDYPNDTAEQAALGKLASISSAKARQVAASATGGKPTEVALENEKGSVVYNVDLNTSSGTLEVAIDAGNARVLGQDSDQKPDAPAASPR